MGSDELRERLVAIIDDIAWNLRETLRGDRQLEERIAEAGRKADAAMRAIAAAQRAHTDSVTEDTIWNVKVARFWKANGIDII